MVTHATASFCTALTKTSPIFLLFFKKNFLFTRNKTRQHQIMIYSLASVLGHFYQLIIDGCDKHSIEPVEEYFLTIGSLEMVFNCIGTGCTRFTL